VSVRLLFTALGAQRRRTQGCGWQPSDPPCC